MRQHITSICPNLIRIRVGSLIYGSSSHQQKYRTGSFYTEYSEIFSTFQITYKAECGIKNLKEVLQEEKTRISDIAFSKLCPGSDLLKMPGSRSKKGSVYVYINNYCFSATPIRKKMGKYPVVR